MFLPPLPICLQFSCWSGFVVKGSFTSASLKNVAIWTLLWNTAASIIHRAACHVYLFRNSHWNGFDWLWLWLCLKQKERERVFSIRLFAHFLGYICVALFWWRNCLVFVNFRHSKLGQANALRSEWSEFRSSKPSTLPKTFGNFRVQLLVFFTKTRFLIGKS